MPANPRVGDVFEPEDLIPLIGETAEVVRGCHSKSAGGLTIAIEETSALELGTTTKLALTSWKMQNGNQLQFDFLYAGVAVVGRADKRLCQPPAVSLIDLGVLATMRRIREGLCVDPLPRNRRVAKNIYEYLF